MKRALLPLLFVATLASCNAINGLSDLEKVDCVGPSCGAVDSTVDGGDASNEADVDPSETLDAFDAADDAEAEVDTADVEEVAEADADEDAEETEVGVDAAPDGDAATDADATDPCPVATKSCYTGPSGTLGKGACVAGVQHCIDGAFGPCIGEVLPTPETCNGVDDDCNGTVDDGLGSVTCGVGACKTTKPACTSGAPTTCVPPSGAAETCNGVDDDCDGAIDEDACTCIHVAPTGSDTAAGTPLEPMRTINAAIAKAATGPKRVCVASGALCGTTVDYPEAVVMKDGVSVYGGYQAAGAVWARVSTCVTRIVAQNARGVVFDASVKATTILDGFTVTGGSFTSNAAITIEGSVGAVVNNVIVNGGSGTTSVGIDVLESGETKATPVISRSTINGGTGTALAIGVRSVRSAPTIQDVCDTFDAAGRCNMSNACATSTARQIRGRTSTTGTTARAIGVLLSDSPGAAIARSAVCSGVATTESNAVQLTGDLTNTRVVASSLHAHQASLSIGLNVAPCADGSPWVFNNFEISAESKTTSGRADGVRAIGACHPRIDTNLLVAGNEDGSTSAEGRGVYCGSDSSTSTASQCIVAGNVNVFGNSGTTAVNAATGVHCDDGACRRIERNGRIAGASTSARTAIGLSLGDTGTFVSDNQLDAGCSTFEGTGLLSRNSFARVENCVVRGSICSSTSAATSFAVRVLLGSGRNEIDLHSNTLFAQGSATTCTSRAMALDLLSGASPGSPRGLVRNNIFNGGLCSTSYHFDEIVSGADPRVFLNNDLWSAPVTALYRDEASTNLITIGSVNSLVDIVAKDNISADPVFTTGFRISATSACRDKGTSEGAPKIDFDGDPRPLGTAHDIGADEFKP